MAKPNLKLEVSNEELLKLSIRTMLKAKPMDLIDKNIGLIIDNMQDIDTDEYAKRQINISLIFQKNEDIAGQVDIGIKVKPVLAASIAGGTSYFGEERNGTTTLGELVDEQMEMDIAKEAIKTARKIRKFKIVENE